MSGAREKETRLSSSEKVHVDDDRGWCRASLRIFGETLKPEEVGAKLGLVATRSHLKGERRSKRHTSIWHESGWLLESPLPKESNMPEHLKWLLDAVETRIEVLGELSGKYKVDLFCGFSSGNGQGGFELDSATLGRLARLKIPLNLDLYPPNTEDATATELR